MTLRVMITGAGSGVGQGIVKSLRLSELSTTLVMADIDAFNPGFYRGDEAVIIPKVEDGGAREKMIAILREQRIDAFARGQLAGLVLFFDARSTSAFAGRFVTATHLLELMIAHDVLPSFSSSPSRRGTSLGRYP
ncbi:MAG: hypothetical protein IH848_04115 [Acidobacteria bacterium]|nr:hypothetical protein [Acidobacteriota bacterium]